VFVTAVLADLHDRLKTFYSDIGRPSVDPELMIRMLLVGYCYGIRHERRLCQEVALHLAYRTKSRDERKRVEMRFANPVKSHFS
jgi:transposase